MAFFLDLFRGRSSDMGSRVPMQALRWIAMALLIAAAGNWLPTGLPRLLAQDELGEVGEFESDAPAPTAESAGESETADREPENLLMKYVRAAGFIGAAIALLSLVTVGFIIEHFVTIRASRMMPEEVSHDLENLIHENRVDEAIEYCERSGQDSMLANVIHAGLVRFRESDFGFADYKYAVEEAGEDETGRLYRKTEPLGVIAAIAPMMGLLGTVSGMIGAFNTIGANAGGARPDELAGSIGEALVATFLGLCVAVPSTIFFSFFRNRIDSIVAQLGKRVERVMAPLNKRR